MPVKLTAPSLQQRKQALVRAELARVAWDLFAARGYEATTVQTIARAAGVSRRTFFRYYSSKEDVLVETSDALADELLAEVAARPAGEAPLSIRRALVPARAAAGDAGARARHHAPAAREPGAAPGDAGAARADGGAARRAFRAPPAGRPGARQHPRPRRVPRARSPRHGVQRLVRPGPARRGRARRRAVRHARRRGQARPASRSRSAGPAARSTGAPRLRPAARRRRSSPRWRPDWRAA